MWWVVGEYIAMGDKRFVIKILLEKTIMLFAKSEDEAREKIQDYVVDPQAIESIDVEEVKKFNL